MISKYHLLTRIWIRLAERKSSIQMALVMAIKQFKIPILKLSIKNNLKKIK